MWAYATWSVWFINWAAQNGIYIVYPIEVTLGHYSSIHKGSIHTLAYVEEVFGLAIGNLVHAKLHEVAGGEILHEIDTIAPKTEIALEEFQRYVFQAGTVGYDETSHPQMPVSEPIVSQLVWHAVGQLYIV